MSPRAVLRGDDALVVVCCTGESAPCGHTGSLRSGNPTPAARANLLRQIMDCDDAIANRKSVNRKDFPLLAQTS